jgi:hypothetical protein
MTKSWILFTAVTALLAVAVTAQGNQIVEISFNKASPESKFKDLEFASFMSACHALSHTDTGAAEILVDRGTRISSGTGYHTVKQLAQYKIDCLRKLVDTDLICNVDVSTPGATECSSTNSDGSVNAYTMNTLIFECKSFNYDGLTDIAGCPLASDEFKLAAEYGAQTLLAACPVDSLSTPLVTGYENCEKKAVCAHKTADAPGGIGVDNLVSFGDFCPGQADGTMCCGPLAARKSDGGSGYAVNFNTIDIHNTGAGLKPVVSHVVDLDIQIKYTPGDPARLKAEITVPYITTKSYVNMTSANGGHSYSMCPSM